MLFDEATSALDPEMVKEVLDVMINLANEGIAMICVTHEMGFARAGADRVVFMADGEILEEAPPNEFFSRPVHERARAFDRWAVVDLDSPQPVLPGSAVYARRFRDTSVSARGVAEIAECPSRWCL